MCELMCSVCTCVWKPKFDNRYLPQMHSILFIGTGSLSEPTVGRVYLSNWGSYVSASWDYKHTTTLILHSFYWCWRYAPIIQSSHLRGTVFIHGTIFLARGRTLDIWWHPANLIRVEPGIWELAERLTDAKGNVLIYRRNLGCKGLFMM